MELTRSQTSEEDLCVRTESLSVCEVTVFQTSIYPFIYLCMKDFFFFLKRERYGGGMSGKRSVFDLWP